MNIRNSIRLIGYLGADPETRNLNGDKKISKFSVATSDTYKDEAGNKVTETQWHSIVAWDKHAGVAAKYLKKGSEVAIDGKLINRSYTDKEGNKRYVTEVVCSELLLLGKKSE
jgi:single-strand DNA-binding protein